MVYKKVSIKAQEKAERGSFVTAKTKLVRFEIDPDSIPEGYSVNSFFKKYERPELPPPILADRSGIVYYIRSGDNTREVWITSAFGLPKSMQEED